MMKVIKTIIIILLCYYRCLMAQSENPFPISSPEDPYIDNDMMVRLDSKIENNEYGIVHAVVIILNGYLVFEKYYHKYSRETLHLLASASKTVTCALIGIAIDQGKIKGIDEKLIDLFPEYSSILNNDPLKRSINLKNLLTMTAGFGGEIALNYNKDVVEYMLTLPIEYTPGTVWNYSNGSSMLLSAIIQSRTGKSAEDFADSNLFTPLGISTWQWLKTSNNLTITASGLYLRPLDMAVFGQLYLQEGQWNGKQIISKEWIDESVQVYVKKAKTNRSYGYHIWQFQDSSTIAEILNINDLYFASGANDQKIYVIPHLNCVIVFTCNGADTEAMLQNEILPSVKDTQNTVIKSTEEKQVYQGIDLNQNLPNPFNEETIISYSIPVSGFTTLKIYSSLGNEILTLVSEYQEAGNYSVQFRSIQLASGIYFYKLSAENRPGKTKKMLLMR